MRLWLCFLSLIALAHADEGPPIRRKEIAACNALTDRAQHKQALACIEKLEKNASAPEQYLLFSARLTSLLAQKKLPEAKQLVADKIAAVHDQPDGREAWLHNASNWVAWTSGDLDGALKETEGMKEAAMRRQLSREEVRAIALHYTWDRAYILLDIALKKPEAERAAAVAVAEAARQDYHRIAHPQDEADGLACIDSYFAARLGRGKEAMEHAKKVDLAHDEDLQDVYVVALGYEAGGDKKTAEKLRAQIRKTKNVYPMKYVILRAIEADKRSSPIGKAKP